MLTVNKASVKNLYWNLGLKIVSSNVVESPLLLAKETCTSKYFFKIHTARIQVFAILLLQNEMYINWKIGLWSQQIKDLNGKKKL